VDISELNPKIERAFYFILAIFALLVFITGLFPDAIVDSAKYAAVSRSIFESGDFIHLKINGEPYLQKPPLLFWLGTLSFKLFGISVIAFKLPSLLLSFLGVYSVYRLGFLIFNKVTGLIAALLYLSCEAFMLYNMDVHTDLLLTTNIIFGTWQLAEYLEKKKALNFILGFVGIGLAMISKGVIGLAVPVFSILGYLIVKKDFRTIFSLKWLAAIPILVIILYPALKGLYDQFGISGIKFFFWSNNIDRIKGDYTGGRHDYLYSFHTLIYIFVPWSLYAYTAFIKDFQNWKKQGFQIRNKQTVYCYSAIIIFGLIITISSQQSPHYLLPVIPFIAIITAGLIYKLSIEEKYPRTYNLMLVLRTIMVILLWSFVIVLVTYFFPAKNFLILGTIVLMFIIMVISYIMLKTRFQKLIFPLLITIFVVGFASNTVYAPSALEYFGPLQASYRYNILAKDSEPLFIYNYYRFETSFYPKNVAEFISGDRLKEVLFRGSCWFITDSTGLMDIKAVDETSIVEKHIFPYKESTNLSLKFLNPATRASDLSEIYLLKIKQR